jgi:preprotein translocase subunit SecA
VSLPAAALDYDRLKVREVRHTHKGLDALVFSLHGRHRRRPAEVASFLELAGRARAEADRNAHLPDEEVRRGLDGLRRSFLSVPAPDADVVAGLGRVILGVRRVLGIDPYPVQLAGAASLFHGSLAEMATGEGKTLTVALAAILMGSTGRPCHVITANDYLAARDSGEMAPLYAFFGLAARAVTGGLSPEQRREGYAADVTYTTPKEALADFLRDRLALGEPHQPTRRLIRRLAGSGRPSGRAVMRGLHFAVVDEADSVLIDEAVTPLIISQPVRNAELEQAVLFARGLVEPLQPGRDYAVDFKFRQIHVEDPVLDRLFAASAGLPAVWRSRERFQDLVRTALIAREFYQRDIHYVVVKGKIELIDEFTGRIMEHRTWQQGLHQAVEAKEGIEITPPNESVASMSFQRFFRCYPHLSGLSGTAWESAEELWQIFHLPVLRIPTHRPVQRELWADKILPTLEEKWKEVVAEIRAVAATGRPVLVGTRSVQNSEMLAAKLREAGLAFELLNAVQHEREAEIVAQAGQLGRITIATNMAGRGTDIKLGPGVREAGGLHVVATERHESGRIDRQLIGRAGRQGDPGSARMIVSLEDSLLQRFIPAFARASLRKALEEKPGSWASAAFRFAQRNAERMAFRSRKRVLKHDTWLDENLTFSGKSSAV